MEEGLLERGDLGCGGEWGVGVAEDGGPVGGDSGDAVRGEREGEVHAVDEGGGVVPGFGLHGVAVGGLHAVERHSEIAEDVDEGSGAGDFGS